MNFFRWRQMIVFVAILVVAVVWYLWSLMAHTRTGAAEQLFHISQGESIQIVATRMESEHLIVSKWLFLAYVWKENLRGKTMAGDYLLSGQLTIPEIVFKLTQGESESLSVTATFPEGWDSRKMADRLTANHLPGADFLALVQHPKPEWREQFLFLKDAPESASLEGFLFPDTYSFFKTASAEDIVVSMLGNFERRFVDMRWTTEPMHTHTFFETVTMASIVENEVPTTVDRKLVADLFWRRIVSGQRLESDATLQYILQGNTIQHTFEETRVASPYNTYTNKGLPPGPIGNPGLDALDAALTPTVNDYVFFLSDPVTGETVFAKTYEEHLRNKKVHGL